MKTIKIFFQRILIFLISISFWLIILFMFSLEINSYALNIICEFFAALLAGYCLTKSFNKISEINSMYILEDLDSIKTSKDEYTDKNYDIIDFYIFIFPFVAFIIYSLIYIDIDNISFKLIISSFLIGCWAGVSFNLKYFDKWTVK